ncbi:MAG: hypothetical protein ACI8S6_002147 [Myxococcota bacterium]|jgi:hypothetical protein
MTEENREYTPGRLEAMLLRLGTVGELMALLVRGGRWWMLPLVVVLVTLGIVLASLQAMEYFAPFIYIAI